MVTQWWLSQWQDETGSSRSLFFLQNC